MAYHMPHFDKRLKNWRENNTENFKNLKTEFRDLVNLKLLLNRNELEKIIGMKKMRLDDIFPTTYYTPRLHKRFKN